MLSTASPDAARAAPTPVPTPAPARAPGLAPAPSAGVRPTPSPMRAPAIVASPSAVPASAPTASPARAAPPINDATAEPAPDEAAEDVEAALDWQSFVPTDTADHLATMDRAARDSGCGVPWHLLAAIARVESDFGRNMATSSAGALGYGQFLPRSWASFGNDGNVYDYRDALPAIATYLCQSGLERDPRAALFAYNHADWYVDLVLDLAVRYDRMAPGAPTPGVLDVGPGIDAVVPMHYAPGRDARLQTRPRQIASQGVWLGVPWHGRAPGAAISSTTLETTALAMVRGTFGLTGESPDADGVTGMANRAWNAGLLPVPIEPPVLLPAPDDLRPAQAAQWSVAEIRRNLEQRGQPLVALVAAQLLPGHFPNEGIGDQPIVVIGDTPTGLVYNDPSFSSSLGYGLELSDADFLVAWQAAATPLQALAFSPRPLPRDAHLRAAEPPAVFARALPTPVPATPQTRPTPLPTPIPIPIPTVAVVPVAADVAPTAVRAPAAEDDPSWLIVLGAGGLLAGASLIRRRRARRSP